MKSETFRKQALSLIVFFVAIAAVFFVASRLRGDPAKKQAEFVVQQLLSCSSAVEQAVDLMRAARQVFCLGQGGSMLLANDICARFSSLSNKFRTAGAVSYTHLTLPTT